MRVDCDGRVSVDKKKRNERVYVFINYFILFYDLM